VVGQLSLVKFLFLEVRFQQIYFITECKRNKNFDMINEKNFDSRTYKLIAEKLKKTRQWILKKKLDRERK